MKDREQLKAQHEGWLRGQFTSNGQREDSQTILDLLAEIDRLCEIGQKFRTALMAVKTDAIKCELADSPVQYVITQWAMNKVNACFASSAKEQG